MLLRFCAMSIDFWSIQMVILGILVLWCEYSGCCGCSERKMNLGMNFFLS